MKILICMPYYKPEQNGVIQYVCGLYQQVKQLNPEIQLTILCFDSKQSKILYSKEDIFEIYRLPCYAFLNGSYIIPSIQGLKYFYKIRNENPFDLVHTHTRFFISTLLGYFIAKRQKIPLYHTEHGSSFVKDGSWYTRLIARIYDETLGRLVLSTATTLFGVSKSCVEFAHKLSGKQGNIIYNGIDTQFWQCPNKSQNAIPVISYCGRMVKSKGVQHLLIALSEIRSYPWQLELIGEGNYQNELQILAIKLNINDRIIWHGKQEPEFLKSRLEHTDIFVNPSYTEGMPTSVLEAGAMKCAVIATDVGGTREIITDGDSGFIIPDPMHSEFKERIKKALIQFIDQPSLRIQCGEILEKDIREKFGWTKIAPQFIHYLNSINNKFD